MAQTKATKKFEKNRLKDTLSRRKDFAKVKQRHQVNAKRKARRAAEAAQDEAETQATEQRPLKKQKQQGESLGDMSVDDFFAGGFEIPKAAPQKNGKAASKSDKKRAREEDEDEEDGDDESIGSVEDEPLNVQEDDDDDEVMADDVEMHKVDLKALQEKDPEFYKFMQENDPELLDFAEDAPLNEIDQLSGSEEESVEKKPKKKRTSKGGEKVIDEQSNEVTTARVAKWNEAMTENHSLRALREVVLAFRAAAHLNEENGKDYKYTISNAEGMQTRSLACPRH